MPNQFQSYRARVAKIKKVLEQTNKGQNVFETLTKHSLTIMDILQNPNVPEKNKQRLIIQLKLEGKLK